MRSIAASIAYQFAPHARDPAYPQGDWIRRDVTLGWVSVPENWDVTLACLSAEEVLHLEAVVLSIRASSFNEDMVDAELAAQYRRLRRRRSNTGAAKKTNKRTNKRRENIEDASESPSSSIVKFRELIDKFKLTAREKHDALLW